MCMTLNLHKVEQWKCDRLLNIREEKSDWVWRTSSLQMGYMFPGSLGVFCNRRHFDSLTRLQERKRPLSSSLPRKSAFSS